jgi:hypothetical protein
LELSVSVLARSTVAPGTAAIAAAEAESRVLPVSTVSLDVVVVDEVVDVFVTLFLAWCFLWCFLAASAGDAPASDIATIAAELANDLPSVILIV